MRLKNPVTTFFIIIFAIIICGYMLISVQDISRASQIRATGIVVSVEEEIDIINVDIVRQDLSTYGMKMMFEDRNLRFCDYGSQLACTASVLRLHNIYYEVDTLYDFFYENGLYPEESTEGDDDRLKKTVRYEYNTSTYNSMYKNPYVERISVFNSNDIIEYLKAGVPVLARVSHPEISRYWVLIIGAHNSDFIIMDPLSSTYGSLSQYSSRVYEIYTFISTTDISDVTQ